MAGKAQEVVQDHPDMAKNPAFWIALHDLWQQAELPMQVQALVNDILAMKAPWVQGSRSQTGAWERAGAKASRP